METTHSALFPRGDRCRGGRHRRRNRVHPAQSCPNSRCPQYFASDRLEACAICRACKIFERDDKFCRTGTHEQTELFSADENILPQSSRMFSADENILPQSSRMFSADKGGVSNDEGIDHVHPPAQSILPEIFSDFAVCIPRSQYLNMKQIIGVLPRTTIPASKSNTKSASASAHLFILVKMSLLFSDWSRHPVLVAPCSPLTSHSVIRNQSGTRSAIRNTPITTNPFPGGQVPFAKHSIANTKWISPS